MYGSKSERFVTDNHPDQLQLFDDESKKPAKPEIEKISYSREKKQKKQPKRTVELPKHLRRETEVIEPEMDESQKASAKKIGYVKTEILEYIPGELYVKSIIRPKYAVKTDAATKTTDINAVTEVVKNAKAKAENSQAQEIILIATMPERAIPKGNVGNSLLAYLLVSKYVDHLPFYRLRNIFKRSRVDVAASTIGGWMTQSCELLEGLYHLLVDQVKSSSYIQADESHIKVQDNDKKGSTHQGYMWVYHAPTSGSVVFKYNPTRKQEVPETFFKGVTAVVQTDGYAGYNNLEKHQDKEITLHACMAHARRKFIEAQNNDSSTAEVGLTYIQKLYDIERIAREENMSHKERYTLRQREAVPILKALKTWLEGQQQKLLPKSRIGLAVNYTLNLWSRLVKYTDDGKYEIDNNLVENTIRPIALGRKNYLFAGSHEAAQRAAIMYSLFASCKVNNINPQAWLHEVLDLIPTYSVNNLHELLPSSERFKKIKITTHSQ